MVFISLPLCVSTISNFIALSKISFISVINPFLVKHSPLKNITVGYGMGGNIVQDVAAVRALQEQTEEYLEKFYKTLDYCKKVFADPEYGEWYGYLRRDGKPTEPSTKGSTFKGPFHLPRMLSMVDVMIGEILGE